METMATARSRFHQNTRVTNGRRETLRERLEGLGFRWVEPEAGRTTITFYRRRCARAWVVEQRDGPMSAGPRAYGCWRRCASCGAEQRVRPDVLPALPG